VVNHMLHSATRRAEALGWRYEAHLRGLERCSINLTTTDYYVVRMCSCDTRTLVSFGDAARSITNLDYMFP